MRLALFGPAPPLRGGIVTAQANLFQTLARRGHQLHWTGFKRQYPDFLFPGSSQEGSMASWLDCPNERVFVPWDPISWTRTANNLLAFEPDGVIARWWIPFFAPGFRQVMSKVRQHTRVVWVLDNVVPHESYPLSTVLTRQALKQGHAFVAQSEQVRGELLDLLPDTSPEAIRLAPHPLYDYGDPHRSRPTMAEARRALDIPDQARVLLFFGFIKPYKGLNNLIDAAPQLREHFGPDGVRILVVGDVYGDRQPYLDRIANSGAADIIRFHAEYVADEEVEPWFVASDLVVLPYESATQSGIVQIAWNYDKPVVTTRVGGLPEVVDDGKTGFLVPPGDPVALANACCRFFDEQHASAMTAAVAQEKGKYSWDRQAEAIEDLVSLTIKAPTSD